MTRKDPTTVRRALAISPGSASGTSMGGAACQTCAQTEQRTVCPASPIFSPSTRKTVSQFGQVSSIDLALLLVPSPSIHQSWRFGKSGRGVTCRHFAPVATAECARLALLP